MVRAGLDRCRRNWCRPRGDGRRRCTATGGDDGASSHQYTQKRADAETQAALKATGGGKASSGVETDNENGATYEVEVTKTDGATVDVRLYENYPVVVIEGDSD